MDTTMNREAHSTPQSQIHNPLEKTAASAHQTVDRIAHAASPAIERMAAGAHHAVDKVVSVTAPAAGWVEGKARKLNESTVKAVEGGKEYVRNYPFVTVAAAIAIGMLISFFARSRPE